MPLFFIGKVRSSEAESKDSKGQMELAMPRGLCVFALEYQGLPPRGWLGPIRGLESAKDLIWAQLGQHVRPRVRSWFETWEKIASCVLRWDERYGWFPGRFTYLIARRRVDEGGAHV